VTSTKYNTKQKTYTVYTGIQDDLKAKTSWHLTHETQNVKLESLNATPHLTTFMHHLPPTVNIFTTGTHF